MSYFLHRIEKELDYVDKQIGEKLHLIDKDGDGVVCAASLWMESHCTMRYIARSVLMPCLSNCLRFNSMMRAIEECC